MGAFIVIVLIFIALIKLPRVTTAAAFTMIAFMFVEDGAFLRGLPQLFMFSAIITVAIQLSPRMGGIRAAFSHIKFDKKKLIKQILISYCIIVAGLAVSILLSLFLRFIVMTHAEMIGFLLILVLTPIIGFAVASLVNAFAEGIWGSDEEIEAAEAEKRAKRQLEEQKRLEAEEAAERKRIADEKAADLQRRIAERDAKMHAMLEKEQAEREAERRRINAIHSNNSKAIDDFWNLMISDYGVDPQVLQNIYDSKVLPLTTEINTDEVVLASNDERIEAIENIIKSSGFSANGLQPSRFPYESPMLEYIFSMDSPILGCVDEYKRAPRITVNGKALPSNYLEWGIIGDVDETLKRFGDYYKRCIDTYRSDYGIIKAGLKGEYAVQDVLDMHTGAFIVVHDLRLEFPGKNGEIDSVETDTVVLAPNGIFAIEVKNYGSSGRYKIVVTGDGNWYKEYPPRRDDEAPKREVMKNPFAQNDRHIAYLERFINELLGRDMANWARVENIICLANDEVSLENDPAAKQTLTRVSNLYNQLTYDRTQKFTVEELEKIKAAFDEKRLPGKKYPIPDYSKHLKWAVDWYKYLTSSLATVLEAATKCVTDHQEFFDRIQQ